MARTLLEIPEHIKSNMPGGQRYKDEKAHLKNPFCDCLDPECKLRSDIALSLSGGGSRYGEIAGVAAYLIERGNKVVNISGCSAGSIVMCLLASGIAIGIPNDKFIQALEDALNEPLSPWPWKKKKQIQQKTWLRTWIDEYWVLCDISWSKPYRVRNLVSHAIRLCAPCNEQSPFSPPWSDPWTITMIIKTALFTGVNDNQKCFKKTADLFPEYFEYAPGGWLTNSASALMVDTWNTQPHQVILDRDCRMYQTLAPHIEEWGELSRGKNPALAGITFSSRSTDPVRYKTLDVVSASCSIPALMKPVKMMLDPKNCLTYREPAAAEECGYHSPSKPFHAEFYDGGLWQTMPIGQAVITPDTHLTGPPGATLADDDELSTCETHNVYTPYMANVYSHEGKEINWRLRYFTGPWKPKPAWHKRHIGARIGNVISTLHNCATWDQVCDQWRDKERGNKSDLACTDFREARDFLIANPDWGSDTYSICDHREIEDMPDSRTMKNGWTDKLMVTDVCLGYLSAEMQGMI